MWDIFKNCHITSSRIQWKGKGQQIMKYLLHTLDIYYRLVIGRYHYRWDPSCSWRKPANFPESGFSWMKFRRHMHFYVTLWHANHCGRSVPFRSTHTHWQSTDTSPLKEVKWDMFIMKHYAIITYSMIKQVCETNKNKLIHLLYKHALCKLGLFEKRIDRVCMWVQSVRNITFWIIAQRVLEIQK